MGNLCHPEPCTSKGSSFGDEIGGQRPRTSMPAGVLVSGRVLWSYRTAGNEENEPVAPQNLRLHRASLSATRSILMLLSSPPLYQHLFDSRR